MAEPGTIASSLLTALLYFKEGWTCDRVVPKCQPLVYDEDKKMKIMKTHSLDAKLALEKSQIHDRWLAHQRHSEMVVIVLTPTDIYSVCQAQCKLLGTHRISKQAGLCHRN